MPNSVSASSPSSTPSPPSTSSPRSGSSLLLPPQPLPPHYSISDDNLPAELFPEYTTPKRSLPTFLDLISQAFGDKRRQIAVSDSSPSQTVSGSHLSRSEQTCISLGDGRGGRGDSKSVHIHLLISFPLKSSQNNSNRPNNPTPLPLFFLLQNRNRARKSHLCFSSSSSNSPIDADLAPELSSELATELASEVARIKASLLQREKAMKKSRETLFVDLCQYLGLRAEEAKKRWREMGEEERLECLRMFGADWGLSFHPLSLKSVKETVDEQLAEETPPPISSSFFSFPDFKRMMNFS